MDVAKRICFCGFHVGLGGISHVMLNLVNGFAASGYGVDLLIANRSSPHLASVDPRVRVVEIGSSLFFSIIPRVIAYLRRERPEWVISNREKSNRYMVLARWLSNGRVRIAFRVGNSMTSTLRKRSFLKRWLRQKLIVWSYRQADLVIVNSASLATDVAEHSLYPLERIVVLNNPMYSDDLLREAQLPAEHRWFFDRSVPVVLGVGRLTGQKDFPALIRAFHKLRQNRQLRLIILGEGNDRRQLEELVSSLDLTDSVDFPGYVINPFAYMSKAQLFVLSSAWEGSPNVLIQALSVGCPVVATDCPEGPREILQEGRVAPLVPVGDVSAMAAAMQQVLDAPQDREQLQLAAANFEVKRCVAKYVEALDSV